MNFIKKHIILLLFILLLLFFSTKIKTQNLFHQDIFYGGVTAGGFSAGMGAMTPGDTVSLPLHIEPGSTIRKTYLFTYEVGYPPGGQTIYINGNGYFFDSTSNKIMTSNHASPFASPIILYYKDITENIKNSITDTFDIYFPYDYAWNYNPPTTLNWGWYTAFLYIEYENPNLTKVASTIWINDKDFTGYESYLMSGMNIINTANPVGLSIFSDRSCNVNLSNDGNDVFINSNYLGAIQGSDSINWGWLCAGPKGHFYYQNDTLYGLDDDTADTIMYKTDALADISPYLTNGATGYSMILVHTNYNIDPAAPNINSIFFNAYTTPCDTFSTKIIADTITCKGDSIQLFATGGSNYYWQPAAGLSNPNIANPVASPDSTTLYIVRIENTPGCSRTEHVKIWVIPPPNVVATPTVCGESSGIITAYFDGNYNYSFTLYDSSMQVIDTNSTGVFTQLPYGTYILQSSSQPCTYYDTVTVGYVKKAVASFWRDPYQGQAPLTVEFGNQSLNANGYIWLFPNDTFYTTNLTYTFDTGGVYPVCLVAYNNYPYCADTACYTFVIQDSLQLFAPNVFSPNGDGINDNFTLTLYDFDLNGSITANIYNRWGQELLSKTYQPLSLQLDIWDGTTTTGVRAPEGTYYYVLTYTSSKGEMKRFKGNVTLLR